MDQSPEIPKKAPQVPTVVTEVDDENMANDGGQWVHKMSSAKIGGDDGYVEFTVVGYTWSSLQSLEAT